MSARPASVSCVIACRNGAELIAETLRSIAHQAGGTVEVVVVDDGSTDATAEVVRETVPSARLIRQPPLGVSVARNVGAYASTGQFICFCDADDLWLPGKIDRQLTHLLANPECVMVHTDFEPFGTNPQAVATFTRWRANHFKTDEPLLLGNRVVFSSVMIRREAFYRAGGFRAGVFYSADWLLWTALQHLGRIDRIDDVLVKYRMHEGSATVQMKLESVTEGVAARFFHQLLLAARVAAGGTAEAGLLGRRVTDDEPIVAAIHCDDHECDRAVHDFATRLHAGFSMRGWLRAMPVVLGAVLRQRFGRLWRRA